MAAHRTQHTQFRHSLSSQSLARKRLLLLPSCHLNSCRNITQRSKCTRPDPWFYRVLSAGTPWLFFLRCYLPHTYSSLYRWGQRCWSAGIARWRGFELEDFPKGKRERLTNLTLSLLSSWRQTILSLQSNKSPERRQKINQGLNLLLA